MGPPRVVMRVAWSWGTKKEYSQMEDSKVSPAEFCSEQMLVGLVSMLEQ